VANAALYLRNYFLILNLQLRSRMSFRLNFFVMLIGVFLREFATLALMVVLVQRFDGLAGWSMWEIAFLYSVTTFTFRNYSSFVGGIREVANLVKTGEMDAYLLTPLSPLFLINARNTMVWRAYYNIGILAVTLFCGRQAGIAPTVGNILQFAVMMLSAMLVLFAIYLIVFSFAFRVVEVSSAVGILDEVTKNYMIYPITIYGAAASFLFTFILPLGFAAYYPSAYLLGRTQDILYHPMLGVLTPLFALLWLGIASIFWQLGVRRYESTGS
jgi:ABC-2 type transport system permease protein